MAQQDYFDEFGNPEFINSQINNIDEFIDPITSIVVNDTNIRNLYDLIEKGFDQVTLDILDNAIYVGSYIEQYGQSIYEVTEGILQILRDNQENQQRQSIASRSQQAFTGQENQDLSNTSPWWEGSSLAGLPALLNTPLVRGLAGGVGAYWTYQNAITGFDNPENYITNSQDLYDEYGENSVIVRLGANGELEFTNLGKGISAFSTGLAGTGPGGYSLFQEGDYVGAAYETASNAIKWGLLGFAVGGPTGLVAGLAIGAVSGFIGPETIAENVSGAFDWVFNTEFGQSLREVLTRQNVNDYIENQRDLANIAYDDLQQFSGTGLQLSAGLGAYSVGDNDQGLIDRFRDFNTGFSRQDLINLRNNLAIQRNARVFELFETEELTRTGSELQSYLNEYLSSNQVGFDVNPLTGRITTANFINDETLPEFIRSLPPTVQVYLNDEIKEMYGIDRVQPISNLTDNVNPNEIIDLQQPIISPPEINATLAPGTGRNIINNVYNVQQSNSSSAPNNPGVDYNESFLNVRIFSGGGD